MTDGVHTFLRPIEAVCERIECSCGEVVVLMRPRPANEGEPSHNDDCALVHDLGDGNTVLAVADGAGGHRQGGAAAVLAIETLATHLGELRAESGALQASVLAAFDRAANAVRELGSEAVTTLSVAVIEPGSVRTLHAGDSPIYVFGQRGRRKWQTMDHTPVGLGIEGGWIEVAEGRDHPERHLLTNFLGMEELRIEMGPRVELARHDSLVLASDGLSDNATATEIIDHLRSGRILRQARQLEALVSRRMLGEDPRTPGKPDDLTLLRFHGKARM